MSEYLVLVENDESQWSDITGVTYHFPSKYLRLMSPGTKFIYYKSKIRNKKFAASRLSNSQHYFGKGTIKDVVKDGNASSSYFAQIADYVLFKHAVDFKVKGEYLEKKGHTRSNYFRDGVREISTTTYNRILSMTNLDLVEDEVIQYESRYFDFESKEEGSKKVRYSSYYERNPFNRQKAIDIHGLRCEVCSMRFDEVYGELGKNFIHVHHIKPISSYKKSFHPNIETDFAVLCPNCHAMIHRPRNRTLTVNELKMIYYEINKK